ncbi:MAG: MarR family winged helix-turn-helix transcriptional regulator [Proteobacteria bacterium]|nr:MarR family winged helix-turn-helix transcriptional regulator [Pseudomonadota bacterium]
MAEKSGDKPVDEFDGQVLKVRNLLIEFLNKVADYQDTRKQYDFGISKLKALTAFKDDREYTMTELSRNAYVSMPTMTDMVDSLVEEGIAERRRDEQDRRVVKVTLTEKGKKMRKVFMERRRQEVEDVFGKLSFKDRKDLSDAMDMACTILRKIRLID